MEQFNVILPSIISFKMINVELIKLSKLSLSLRKAIFNRFEFTHCEYYELYDLFNSNSIKIEGF